TSSMIPSGDAASAAAKSIEQVVGGILADVKKGESAHRERVAQFLADVLAVGVDLHGENQRHFDSLRTVLGRELERWELLAEAAQQFAQQSAMAFDATNWQNDDILPVFFDPATQPSVGSNLPIMH